MPQSSFRLLGQAEVKNPRIWPACRPSLTMESSMSLSVIATLSLTLPTLKKFMVVSISCKLIHVIADLYSLIQDLPGVPEPSLQQTVHVNPPSLSWTLLISKGKRSGRSFPKSNSRRNKERTCQVLVSP